jgi:predicted DsbA family dithiol-disulfide isomerase/uncharacterized membrane protein
MPAASPPPVVTPFRQPRVCWRWIAFGLSGAGWLVSLTLLLSVAGAPRGGTLLDTFCGGVDQADRGWDCRSVLNSQWGYLQLGVEGSGLKIPVSALGMAYFAFVGLWYLFIGPTTRDRRIYHALLLLIVLHGAARSAHFIWIMAFTLHQWCIGCLAAHVLNFALLAVTFIAWPWRAPAVPWRPHPTGRLALAAVTAGLLAAFAHLAVMVVLVQRDWMNRIGTAYREVIEDPAYVLWRYQRQPEVDLSGRDDAVYAGDAEAPYRLVVFSDFQCTQCRRAHRMFDELLQKYPAKLRIAFRHAPQDPACNPDPRYQSGGHPVSCEAARALEAARMVGGREAAQRLSSILFENQAALESEPMSAWAALAGLDADAFAAALDAPAAAECVRQDIALAARIGVEHVPMVYLNGRRLDGWSNPSTWEALLTPPPTTAEAP